VAKKRTSRLGEQVAGPGIVLVEPGMPINKWIAAVNFVDVCGDKSSLLKLLRETGAARDLLIADLLERHQLRRQRKRGGQSPPIYDLSRADWMLVKALNEVRNLRRSMSREAALEAVSNKHRIHRDVLEPAYKGKRSDLYRTLKRLAKLRPPKKSKGRPVKGGPPDKSHARG
jgi:hypothetical protein